MEARHHRLSLWKRAALHGLKTLVRKHPGAALHAAGASIAYAGREAVHDGAEFVKAKIEDMSDTLEHHSAAGTAYRPPHGSDAADARVLVEQLSPNERRALARLARRKSE
jgi:hypothetical protein